MTRSAHPREIGVVLTSLAFLLGAGCLRRAQAQGTNIPPEVSIVWPNYTLTVTNLPEGGYQLSVRGDNPFVGTASLAPGACEGPVIRVTKLGIQPPRLKPDGRIEFDVVTSFPTKQNVIEASSNLLNWFRISTNVPSSNTFTFTEPSPAMNSPRFYRAVVPSQ